MTKKIMLPRGSVRQIAEAIRAETSNLEKQKKLLAKVLRALGDDKTTAAEKADIYMNYLARQMGSVPGMKARLDKMKKIAKKD